MSQPFDPQNPGQTPPPPAPYPAPQAPQYGAPQTPQYPAPQAPQFAQAPQYAAPAYGAPAYGAPAQPPKTPGIAIAALILAIVAAPIGLIVSFVALPKTKRAGAGRGLAITGVILGLLGTIGAVIGITLIVKGVGAVAQPAVAVSNFNTAIDTNDCQLFFDNTSQAYLDSQQVTDCSTFSDYAAQVTEGSENYRVSISGVSVENGVTTVTTNETYTLTETGAEQTDSYTYTLVQEDGAWKVDNIVLN